MKEENIVALNKFVRAFGVLSPKITSIILTSEIHTEVEYEDGFCRASYDVLVLEEEEELKEFLKEGIPCTIFTKRNTPEGGSPWTEYEDFFECTPEGVEYALKEKRSTMERDALYEEGHPRTSGYYWIGIIIPFSMSYSKAQLPPQ